VLVALVDAGAMIALFGSADYRLMEKRLKFFNFSFRSHHLQATRGGVPSTLPMGTIIGAFRPQQPNAKIDSDSCEYKGAMQHFVNYGVSNLFDSQLPLVLKSDQPFRQAVCGCTSETFGRLRWLFD
jgi:hypothetical protein